MGTNLAPPGWHSEQPERRAASARSAERACARRAASPAAVREHCHREGEGTGQTTTTIPHLHSVTASELFLFGP